jgi:eukaryotic-like serine/threonine-protein kinase
VTPAIPSNIGKYEVTKVLGRGGMGVVYLGFDRHLGRQVAIKTLTEGFIEDKEMLKRFYREATKTGTLMHPNIVIVYDVGEQGGFPYIVMEFVPGESLERIIQSNRYFPVTSKLAVIEQVCLALGYAHRNDVIHRDVKPANVIVQQDDNTKLLDFGIAHHENVDREQRLTKAGNVVGTMRYMAPERLRGAPFDGRSDLFSTGVMLYELITGHLPFHGEDVSLFHQILHEPAPPLSKYLMDYPAGLETVIERTLAKNPVDRYSDAEEMAADIAAIGERIRKEQGVEMFRRAEQLVNTENYLRARDVLDQLIKLDSKNIDARKLLATIQANLAVRQRSEQVQELRLRAEEAIEDKAYDQATSLLEQAVQLDPSNAEAQNRLEVARQGKHKQDEIANLLRKADHARETGDFETAHSHLQEAMKLDDSDPSVKAAGFALNIQIKEAAKQREVKAAIESAKSEIQARRFTAAIQLLQDAAQTDPGNGEIMRLLQNAQQAKEQEARRKLLEQVQNEANSAVNASQITSSMETVESALQQMPAEASLLQLKAQLNKRFNQLQVRTRVDETVRRCYPLMESSPQEALSLVQEQLRDLPAEERLLVLQSAIEERLAHLKLEEARSRYMTRAHEAIRSQRYREAVQVLEACHSEGLFSEEMTDLLEFARHEARREERNALVETAAAKAQALISQGSYDQVIALLEPLVAQYDDPSLRVVLEKARSERHSEQLRLQSVFATLQQLTSFQQWEEAIAFLEQQPEAVHENDAVRSALAELREANDQEARALQATGAAYAALHRADLPTARQQTEAMRTVPNPSELATRMVNTLDARVIQVADHVVANSLSEARQALQQRDPKRAVEILAGTNNAKDYATLEVRQDWQALKKQAGKAKLLGRVGIRVNRSDATPK